LAWLRVVGNGASPTDLVSLWTWAGLAAAMARILGQSVTKKVRCRTICHT
jgi:hypothetical protein